MEVLALTIFVGFVLVTQFVVLWVLQVCNRHNFTERESLLPLEDDVNSANHENAQSPRL